MSLGDSSIRILRRPHDHRIFSIRNTRASLVKKEAHDPSRLGAFPKYGGESGPGDEGAAMGELLDIDGEGQNTEDHPHNRPEALRVPVHGGLYEPEAVVIGVSTLRSSRCSPAPSPIPGVRAIRRGRAHHVVFPACSHGWEADLRTCKGCVDRL
ncbi:hypothetical protein CALVIDRAFT_238498 [Calocera viscosa TUFC12733]|uniref:Uncharacterized protein n=1 Tax=Calocera viscosa (strain TUFC12733) TaxID=1330018 RepID=A0A167JVA5_CALVF|nr:hypothetical protein CALVIDRAFT_238498 [Calocera viscosa TUFC12733]